MDRYLVDLAGQIGLEEGAFAACLASGRHREEVLADQKLEEVEKIRQQVAEAADFAESSPEPDMAELYTDVLVETY